MENQILICDIDDTIIHNGHAVNAVIEWVDAQNLDVFLVTGRLESTRAETEKLLADLGIKYEQLFMNDLGSANQSVEFKKMKAEKLMEEFDIELAIDNSADARDAYASLGIDVVDPAHLPDPSVDMAEDTQEPADAPSAVEMNSTKWTNAAKAILRKLDPIQEAPMPETRSGKLETRVVNAHFEMRAETPAGSGMQFSGYAAMFNSPSEPLPFTEVIAPGAFKRSLSARNDVKLLWNHDTSIVLGSTRSGTLQLVEDSQGLKAIADLPDTQAGRDASTLMKRGDVTSMSFGFTVPKGGDTWSADGQTRTLNSVRLHEVSIVAFPAYQATSASVRSSIDTDELAGALEKLETGSDLNETESALLQNIIGKLTKTEVLISNGLDVKQKNLELLMSKI
jgi:HK97 family phage prohead protease